MTSVANPNWLAISAAFFILSGLGVLAKAFLASTTDAAEGFGQRQVNTTIGTPVLGLGFFMQAASQLGTTPINAFIVCMLLALALGLLIYAAMEDFLVDAYRDKSAVKAKLTKLSVVPPATEPAIMAEPLRLEAVSAI